MIPPIIGVSISWDFLASGLSTRPADLANLCSGKLSNRLTSADPSNKMLFSMIESYKIAFFKIVFYETKLIQI